MLIYLVASALRALPIPPQSSKAHPVIYTVATAHLDTNWLWTIQDTIRDHLPKTLRENFNFFEKYPDYNFNFEGAIRYKLIKEYYPEQYARLKDYIAAGRWKVSGSWVDAVDTNIPSPESLIRQCLYGNGYFKKEFGKTSKDVFLPDCFGFGFALPSIARHCGLIGFSTQKLDWGSAVGKPFSVGVWTGVDGSSIYAALDPDSYGSSLPDNLDEDKRMIAQAVATGKNSGEYVAYRYHGTGDTGGAPSEKSVQNLEAGIKTPGTAVPLSASSDDLFRKLEADKPTGMPSYKGELLLTTHGTGCYTSQAAMKMWNRENENLAMAAEGSATIADWLGGEAYPHKILADSWTRFLWHQFHDDLTGTSIPQVYPFSWNDEAISLNNFAQVTESSLNVLAAGMNTQQAGIPVVVYNPIATARKETTDATLTVPQSWKYLAVFDASGNEVPSQINHRYRSQASVSFVATVPSLGSAVFSVRKADRPCSIETGLKWGIYTDKIGTFLENRFYRITINSDQKVSSIFDKASGKELLKEPLDLQLLNDFSPDWPGWEVKYKAISASPREVMKGVDVVPIETGPARVRLLIHSTDGKSTVSQSISLTAFSSRIDFPTSVHWNTRGTLMKAKFSLTASNAKATYDLGLGAIQRGNDQPKLYEVPAQKWADLTDASGKFGVSFLTDCKYGWDKPNDGEMRLSLLHTPSMGRDWQYQATNDLGDHHFTYSVMGHGKVADHTATVWEAEKLNHPLIVLQTSHHAGFLGRTFSMAASSKPSVQIMALKESEDSSRLIVRVFEKSGHAQTNAWLRFAAPVMSVREVNGQEEPIVGSKVTNHGNRILFGLTRFQPRAFEVVLARGKQISKAATVTIPITGDTQLTATAGTPLADGQTAAIPAELVPSKLTCGGIPFNLKNSRPDGLACRSNQIAVPAGAVSVDLLVVSLNGDKTVTFDSGYSTEATIPDFTRSVAQWNNRIVDGKVEDQLDNFGKPYIVKTPLAWFASHRLNADGSVEPYKYCYVYRLRLPIKNGVRAVTLPNDPSVVVMAATAVTKQPASTTLATELYH